MEAPRKILNENITHNELKGLDFDELNLLSSEIRDFLIGRVSENGGHLASNLGVVELTVMLHRYFDFEGCDRLVFDVGHQSYVHKILTGRMGEFSSLRKKGGMSGFPRREENKTDLFDTGHSGTSISMASGVAAAKGISEEEGTTVALIGDGAFTGGICYEAINNISKIKGKVIIVLNDNGMSISENVGALSELLTRVRTSSKYVKAKEEVKGVLHTLNKTGAFLERNIRRVKDTFKLMMIPSAFTESFGVKYLGPVDGHNLKQLDFYIRRAMATKGPVILHVNTVKGKGYRYAEERPDKFHGISRFEVDNGETRSLKEDYSHVVGLKLSMLASENKKLAVICPAMTRGCGLEGFAELYPERFFDCGIAESHAVSFASGLAEEGIVPVVCTYSTFFQRAYDEMWHDVAINRFHVVFCLDRAGFPGNDGKTHQGIYDLSYLGSIPGMAVLSPSCFKELEDMLSYAVNCHNGPIAVRYPKGNEESGLYNGFTFGKAEVLKEGSGVTLCCEGIMTKITEKAVEIASEKGISVELIKLSTIYPTDFDIIEKSVEKTGSLITLEGNIKKGGMGECIFAKLKCPGEILAFPNEFIEHGRADELLKENGLDAESIAERILKCAGGNHEA